MKKYNYGKQKITLSDIWQVLKTLKSPHLTQGPKVKEFEDQICKYTGAKYAVAVCNGGAALHLSCLALGLKKGDAVITTPNTFLASANCALYVGADIHFADIDSETANIDPEEIKKILSTCSENLSDRAEEYSSLIPSARRNEVKTGVSMDKAIIPVHFAGQSCDMEKIYEIAKEHNLFVIEDAAHAIGSEYKNGKVGNCKYSDLTIFSFHPVKTITTGEGGMITTNNKELYEKLLMLRTYGVTKDPDVMTKNDGPWYYEMHYLGYNYRMTDIQAALGISQLKKLDKVVKRRREIVEFYKKELANDPRFSFLRERDYSKAAFHLCPLLINFEVVKKTKKEIFNDLKNAGLNLQVHYIPVHLQPYYQKLGFKKGDYPNAEKYYEQTISLPLYPSLKGWDLKKIVEIIKEIIY